MSDTLSVAWALAWIRGAQAVLAENREALNDLDRAIGDGDHGENMDRGMKAVVDIRVDATVLSTPWTAVRSVSTPTPERARVT